MSIAFAKTKVDRLGAAITLIGAIGAGALPFVTYRANRIVSGAGKSIIEALPLTVTMVLMATLVVCAFVALLIRAPFARLAAGFGLLCALAFAASSTASLIPAGNVFARIALASGFWVLLLAALLLCADAFAKLRLGPLARLGALLLVGAGVASLLMSGQLNHLSILREYATYADNFWLNGRIHIALAVGSVALAVLIGVPLGLAAFRHRRLRGMILQSLNLIQTIPSIALFGLLMGPLAYIGAHVPFAAQMGVSGIGFFPAFIALLLYSLLPVTANTIAGLNEVPLAIIDAARGMGMNKRQILLSVEAPLAMPALLTSVRIVLVQNIGLAAVAALIGGGGLGTYVFQGLGQSAIDLVLLGTVPIIALAFTVAVILECLVEWIQGSAT